MKKILIGAFSIVLLSTAAQAQVTKKHEGHKQHHQAALSKLNLTEAQKAQLKTLHEQQRKEMQELKKNDGITVKESKAKRKALHDKYKAQYQSILTPEQRTQLAQNKGKGKAHAFGKGKKEKNYGLAKGTKVAKDLNLTPEQKQKFKDVRTGFKTKAASIKSNTALTKDQKKAQFEQLKKEQKEQMKTVLTKEQQDKWQAHQKERKNKVTK